MTRNSSLSIQSHKLCVTVRIEPGCLGPHGSSHVEQFCEFAHKEISQWLSHCIDWVLVPRYDKTQDEIQYSITKKNLSPAQAAKLLRSFNVNFTDFSDKLDLYLADLLEAYFEQK